MNRIRDAVGGTVSAVRASMSSVALQSERSIMLGVILLASAASGVMSFVLAQYYAMDVFSSLVFDPHDCFRYWELRVGQHCFSDYTEPMTLALRPNPWEPEKGFSGAINYPAGALVPSLVFGLIGSLLNAPRLGLFGYLFALSLAVLSPAIWAARGAGGLERTVVFVACGAAAIPVLTVIDRANSVGFVVPIALVFLIALCRRRWGLVAMMVILAALVKPQFAVLIVVLFGVRQWRMAGVAVAGGVASNLAAYLLWPRDFPHTIMQSVRATFATFPSDWLTGLPNLSFAKALLAIPDGLALKDGKLPPGYLAGPRSMLGFVVVIVVAGGIISLGKRIPPVMAGIILLATASFFPAMTNRYYLVFVLPIAALIARDPDGSPGAGIFDRLTALTDRRRAVFVWLSLATALSIAQIPLPSPPIPAPIKGQMGVPGIVGYTQVVVTTAAFTPFFWLIACAAVLFSYARRPAAKYRNEQPVRAEHLPNDDLTGSAQLLTDASPRSP